MKLVDILAREMKVWPEGAVAAVQQNIVDGRVSFVDCMDVEFSCGQWDYMDACMRIHDQKDAHQFERASDWKSSVVTRAEWQAAVDALNAPKVVEWDGVSLPPKGTAVEVRFACEKIGSEWPWHSGVVVASGPQPEGGTMVAVEANGFTVALRVTSDFIRPARTDEQVAAEDREKAIKDLYYTINWNDEPKYWDDGVSAARKADYAKAIDSGYTKVAK